MRKFRIQLVDMVTKAAIQTAGGKAYVALNGEAKKATLYDEDGAALSNPVSLTNGILEFYTADSVSKADLFVQSPTGHFTVIKDVIASGPNSLYIDTSRLDTVMVIPFSIDDTTATTETDTGFDLPTNAAVIPDGIGVNVLTLDATETIDVGILSSESGGDANGFLALASVAAAVFVPGATVVTTGSNETYLASTTLGALVHNFLAGADVAGDVGTSYKKLLVCDGTAKSISYTLTAGTDTAEGFITIPLQLPYASL